ncbi:MAG: OmpA family protein [Saprospiraceae bacterium]|nr:OmpA family protein [Saprospiraceae bacterium]
MTFLLAVLCLLLIAVIVIQISRVTELASKIRGDEEMQLIINKRQANLSLVFVVLFLIGCIASALVYKNWMLGYGPHKAASEHGGSLDSMFDITLFFTGIVFVVTQIALFYFAWKYKGEKGRTALFMSHNNQLEIIWTAIPAIVMAFLVIKGLDTWNQVMADVDEGEDFIEIEATGYQFAWAIRYPGPDNQIGTKNYKMITGLNPLGQDWTDTKNLDDIHADKIVLPVNKKVRVRITSRDVLHNFYLPHFRVKMDAVPGIPTYFIFTPTKTTAEYREGLQKYEQYQQPADPSDPTGPKMWEAFNYELACAELCGNGHFSMRRIVEIVSEDEYNAWLSQQKSYYLTSVRGTDEDPNKDKLFDFEIKQRKQEFTDAVEKAISSDSIADKTLKFNYVNFETGAANLTPLSQYELDNLVEVMNKYPNMTIEIAGHTDNTGDAAQNQILSQNRSQAVYDYIVGKGIAATRLRSVGYGQDRPIDTNDTEAGRANNRRTEFRILNQSL